MDLKHTFHFSIYSSVIISALMVTLAEGNLLPGIITVPLALLAWRLVEGERRFALNIGVVNFLGLVAFAAAATEHFSGREEARLLSGAHLISYLLWIVLFQRKHRPQYWWLCALGVLQVAVGSVLTKDPWYGSALFGYLILLVWTLSVFSLYDAKTRFQPDDRKQFPRVSPANGRRPVPVPARLHTAASQSRDAVQIDPDEPWISRRFMFSVVMTVLGSLVVGGIVFAGTPRRWLAGTPFSEAIERAARRRTGFNDEVSLDNMGSLLESDERVFDVRLSYYESDEPVPLEDYEAVAGFGELYFRGTALMVYGDGRWRRLESTSSVRPRNLRGSTAVEPGALRERYLRHDYRLDTYRRRLFVLWPSHTGLVDHPKLSLRATRIDRGVSVEGRRDDDERDLRGSSLNYTMFTTDEDRLSQGQPIRGLTSYYVYLPEGLERLRAKAREVAGVDSATPDQYQLVAERIRTWLSEGDFTYSLNLTVHDPGIDPIEDFLFNRREGHCQYFASAMTLMLRAVNVPALIVTGFKGGYQNYLTDRLEVQSRHAHAWVEVPIGDKWRIFEPTPAARTEIVASMDPTINLWANLVTTFKDFWRSGVLNVTYGRQRQLFFLPMERLWRQTTDKYFGKDASVEGILRSIGFFLSHPERWFSWQGGVVAFCSLTFVSLLIRARPLRRLLTLLQRLFGTVTGRTSHQGVIVEFYEKFRALCEKNGLYRRPEQTQLEFAGAARQRFARQLEPAGLSGFPQQLAALFYDIRFGRRTVSDNELVEIRNGLGGMERCLADGSDQSHGSQAKH